MEHANALAYARKLKNFNVFGACNARQVNLQHLYLHPSESVVSVLSVLRVFYQKTDGLKFLLLAFMKLAWFVLFSV